MTVILGINWFTELVMIGDTRVSWPDRQPMDILRKIYTLGDAHNTVALGFTGSLHTARIVFSYLRDQNPQWLRDQSVVRYKRRRLTISRFKDDLRRWLEHVAVTQLTVPQRQEISIMLCGVEPSRQIRGLAHVRFPGNQRTIEPHIYVYQIKDSGEVIMSPRPMIGIIGPNRQMQSEIFEKVSRVIKFGFETPKLHGFRAALLGQVVALMAQESESLNATIGGPFQIIRYTADGAKTLYVWPPDPSFITSDIESKGSLAMISNPTTGKKHHLYSIWDSQFAPVQ